MYSTFRKALNCHAKNLIQLAECEGERDTSAWTSMVERLRITLGLEKVLGVGAAVSIRLVPWQPRRAFSSYRQMFIWVIIYEKTLT
jgi:hypothetical protein